MTETTTTTESPRICHVGGSGLLLPLGGDGEARSDKRFRIFLYGAGLLYSFIGVSIVADIFMSAIERITSRKKRVRIPGTKRFVTKNVWNETVANLTLMALGSSAPEILLAMNDVVKNRFISGELGPSTIVGSAAFNLFVIIAVCINAIPAGETKHIKEVEVFAITAAWSIFAYLWLLLIVSVISPLVIEIWEGAITCLLFPILVGQSYMSDVGMLTKENFWGALSYLAGSTDKATDDEENDVDLGLLSCCLSGCAYCCGRLFALLKWCLRHVAALLCAVLRVFCCCCIRLAKRKKKKDNSDELDQLEIGDGLEEQNQNVIKDDDERLLDEDGAPIECEEGVLTFTREAMDVWIGFEEKTLTIPVLRKNGCDGRVSVQYRCDSISATPGFDFEDVEGQLDFRSGVKKAAIEITVLPKRVGEKNDVFQLVLEDPEGGAIFNPETDGGEDLCILTICLRNEHPSGDMLRSIIDSCVSLDDFRLGTSVWKEQIIDALFVNGSREEQAEANWIDWAMHFFFFPWKIYYAVLTPPPVYIGGWVCFVLALFHIACLTMVIGDMAELFGCVASVSDNITAITFVALGTSLPDTFASKTAAMHDEFADASIVNVTGSNSVNVFLGIGMPWCTAAIYWYFVNADGPTERWLKYHGPGAEDEISLELYPRGGFVVRGANDLTFSVIVFSLFAFVCLCVIRIRRVVFGGELGGPSDFKATSSFLLVILWVFYIGLQIWKAGQEGDDPVQDIIAILTVVPALVVLMIIFLILLQVLKVSKKYIGQEGFWGIFVAICLLGIRMVVFLMFQTT
mmetsp:Transcript_41930/g.115634  ORF Transcript_41930/g.115634 Transcript_41930/m.115634 type:complete len:799 (+) Transcript_41930:59-2455(+)|eukprot:CAMPEP_0117469166 /NCGR_PEP_ID=MMETSP0784-20121206/6550_1 /TAXON_ID=39447 /ORGANISM="" /LENGTH=798 /DNA_ID=CAMNT_0005263195 /DNA_START=59 /DNA_END=2455 /DNA_ORIENTATION=+